MSFTTFLLEYHPSKYIIFKSARTDITKAALITLPKETKEKSSFKSEKEKKNQWLYLF